MPTLDKLKRCPKCKSADLTFPWQRGTLPDCWHCHSCLENFDTPITFESSTAPTKSAASETLRELLAEHLFVSMQQEMNSRYGDHGHTWANIPELPKQFWRKHADALMPTILAATDSLIETAIERCAQIADEEFVSYHDAANKIRALTLASIKESCRAKL